jgi:hypothetical protein
MAYKAYTIHKEGDYYVIPAGTVHGRYYKETRTMSKDAAKDIIASRKSISLKRKYPEIRTHEAIPKPRVSGRTLIEMQKVKEIPDYISGGTHGLLKRQGSPTASKRVAQANENYYKHHGYMTVILEDKQGKYVLYVSEKKV